MSLLFPRALLRPMNVQSAIAEIHARIQRQTRLSPAVRTPLVGASEMRSLRSAYESMYRSRHMVGEMPPSPETLRAKVGKQFIRLMQRGLFWYTPQIHRFQDETTQALGSVCKLLESQMDLIETLQRELKNLRITAIDSRPIANATESHSVAHALPLDFEAAMQDHFRGSEDDTKAKLAHWIPRIHQAIGEAKGLWLDLGCGRGEWLDLVTAHGYQACGVDSNPLSIGRCRARGYPVEQGEALDYLAGLPDSSLSVITAFHVVEHLPMNYLLALIRLSHSKLCAGGVLVIETPNAANLAMGAHRFWNDPTHLRPVPADLLEFSLRYFGFEVLARVDLNPSPAEEHLPYKEIDLIRQVDDHLYGAQDYGIIGRRTS